MVIRNFCLGLTTSEIYRTTIHYSTAKFEDRQIGRRPAAVDWFGPATSGGRRSRYLALRKVLLRQLRKHGNQYVPGMNECQGECHCLSLAPASPLIL